MKVRRTYNAVKSLLAMIGLAALTVFRDLEAALQMYAGALDEPTAQYSAKVFAEKARLDALRQKAKKQQSA